MSEKRKNVRRDLERPAWAVLAPGGPTHTCVLRDVSKTGARLRFSTALDVPASFVLHLASNGTVARKCVVVWRSETGPDIGVEFVARLVARAARQAVPPPA